MSDYHADFPSTFAAVVVARRALVAFARHAGFAADDVADIESALGEALANAAEHGHRPGSRFSVDALISAGRLVIEIRDDGRGFDISRVDPTAGRSDSPRGFGIFIMRALMDSIEFVDRGRCIRLIKALPPTASGEGAAAADVSA